jgi:tripartite-type tricarboxylate transporter receptor subunit TctC
VRCVRLPGVLGALFVCILTLFGVAAVHAQAYPSKPITMIVPFGPGSATDTVARVIAQPLGTALNQNIIIENRPGANGALAALYVARAAPATRCFSAPTARIPQRRS